MHIVLAGRLPEPISREQEISLLSELRERLKENIKSETPQKIKERKLINITDEIFTKYGLKPNYCGPYKPNKDNPEFTSPASSYNIGKGSSNISIYWGVIGTSVRIGQSIYVPDVKAVERKFPRAHYACDPRSLAEILIIKMAKYKSGPYRGEEAARATLDMDFCRVNPLSQDGVQEFENIVMSYLTLAFPGPPDYMPVERVHVPPKDLEELLVCSH